jgi:hypothetical protein
VFEDFTEGPDENAEPEEEFEDQEGHGIFLPITSR